MVVMKTLICLRDLVVESSYISIYMTKVISFESGKNSLERKVEIVLGQDRYLQSYRYYV